jgi:hypothetical protein
MGDLTTVKGTYGRGTPCRVFVYDGWYAVEGSVNVNYSRAMEDVSKLTQPVDVETLMDIDCFTAAEPVESEEDLAAACAGDVQALADEIGAPADAVRQRLSERGLSWIRSPQRGRQ